MKSNKIKKSKILKLCKIISFMIILFSIHEFYFERIPYLEQHKKWHVDLIEKGENVYHGNKKVWNELSENKKKYTQIRINRCENRIKFHNYLIFQHIFSLTLNIVLFVSLFILNRWVKWYLIFWLVSDIFIIPIYYYIIGYDPLLYERFALATVGMKISVIILVLFIYMFYFYFGRHIFKLIDINLREI